MTKTLAMASHKNHNLSANEGFIIFVPKLFACFIGSFNLKMKSQSIDYLLSKSKHIYWIFDLEGEVNLIRDLWISGLQECKGNGFFKVRWAANNFWSDPEYLDFLARRLPLSESTSPISSWGKFNVPPFLNSNFTNFKFFGPHLQIY